MTVDPTLQLKLLLAAFICGMALGVLSDIGRLLCAMLGTYQPPPSLAALYERQLPFLGRSVGLARRPARRVVRLLVLALADFSFPILAALALLLVSFYYNNGGFRLSTVALLLLGLALWRVLCSRRLLPVISRVAFLVAVAKLYLFALIALPFVLGFRFLRRFCFVPLLHIWQKTHLLYLKKRSAALCRRQLAAAQNGFLSPVLAIQSKKEKRNKICRKKTKGRAGAPRPSQS